MTAAVYWTSPSKLKKYLACPDASRLPYVETPPMLAGTIRHWALQAYFQGRLKPTSDEVVQAFVTSHARFGELEPEAQQEVPASIIAAFKRKGFLPDPEHVLSVEGDAIPARYLHRFTPRDSEEEIVLAAVKVNDTWGLRLKSDLLVLPPDNDNVLLNIDWKGFTEDDGDEVQAACSAVANWKMYPGYEHYDFETRHIPTGKIVPHAYPAKDLPEIERFLDSQVRKMMTDRTFEPRLNRWCDRCEKRETCVPYRKATTTPIAETAKAAKADPAPQGDAELIELLEQVSLTRKIAEAREERLTKDLKARLAERPIQHAGSVYTLQDEVSRYTLLPDATRKLLSDLGIQEEECVTLDRKLVEDRIAEVLEGLDDEQRKVWEPRVKAILVATTCKKIKTESVTKPENKAKKKEATAA